MIDRKELWSQIMTSLLQIIVPLAVAGGATGILSVFKESLPQLLYNIFLYVIWGVIVTMLIWLVLRLIIGDSPKKVSKWIKDRRRRKAEYQLVKDWRVMFIELSSLIDEVMNADWKLTDEHKEKYRKLHAWFTNNRSNLLPIWRFFDLNRTQPAHEADYDSTADLRWHVFQGSERDPFSFFYQPLRVKDLGIILEHNRWSDGEVRYVLAELGDRLNEFVQWAGQR